MTVRATLRVPNEALQDYKSHAIWRKFKKMEVIGDSGIDEVTADVDLSEPVEVYDLRGVKTGTSVRNLPRGIYIVRQGRATRTITVR